MSLQDVSGSNTSSHTVSCSLVHCHLTRRAAMFTPLPSFHLFSLS